MSCQIRNQFSKLSSVNNDENEVDFDFFDSSGLTKDKEIAADTNVKPTHFITEAIIETNRNTKSSIDDSIGLQLEDVRNQSHILENLNAELSFKNLTSNFDHDLVNCIAYEDEEFDDDTDSTDSLGSLSDSFSEFTNVTSMSSSNSSLNIMKNNISEHKTNLEFDGNKCYHLKEDNLDLESNVFEENDISSVIKSLDNISIQGSSTNSRMSSLSNGRLKSIRKNKTFTNEQLRKIERENDILLKKIMSYAKPRSKQQSTVHNNHPTKTSAAINRLKQQKQIEHDNYILLNKIRGVKQTRKSIFGGS